jgi:hypothetical protein
MKANGNSRSDRDAIAIIGRPGVFPGAARDGSRSAQSSTLTRALVFFGVGIIMLVMNSIYNKYKGRFNNE